MLYKIGAIKSQTHTILMKPRLIFGFEYLGVKKNAQSKVRLVLGFTHSTKTMLHPIASLGFTHSTKTMLHPIASHRLRSKGFQKIN